MILPIQCRKHFPPRSRVQTIAKQLFRLPFIDVLERLRPNLWKHKLAVQHARLAKAMQNTSCNALARYRSVSQTQPCTSVESNGHQTIHASPHILARMVEVHQDLGSIRQVSCKCIHARAPQAAEKSSTGVCRQRCRKGVTWRKRSLLPNRIAPVAECHCICSNTNVVIIELIVFHLITRVCITQTPGRLLTTSITRLNFLVRGHM